ncbi:MAG TPA: alpha-amylase family protein [Terracidiphilus sp.]|jgi:beta-galactosidase
MTDIPGFTRREFIQASALVTASTALAHAAIVPAALSIQDSPTANHYAAGPVFPYGAVYFRKSNPPEEEWARDHQTAARLGMNIFRHWFMWSAVEVAPGKFDWADYDRMMDLAAKNGIKVVIAEVVTCAPEWAFRKYSHARFLASDGTVAKSTISESSATGGFPGLCLDNPDVQQLAAIFLTTLVERYRNHPALFCYDLWNENTSFGGSPTRMYCYCDASKKKLRDWLRKRYGTLETLGKTWHRYSFAAWEDIEPPVSFSGYADSLDWLQFRIDNAYELFDWRIELVRKLDPNHRITAHGVAGTLDDLPSASHNEWRSAKRVDIYGLTWIAARKGDEPWKQFHAIDLVRGGSRGKPFWHAEAQGGPLWMQPQVIGRPIEDGRIPDAEDVRIWNLITFARGAKGLLYCRWRPLLDGPLFGAFGPFAMDGSVIPQSDMAGQIAHWTNSHPELWLANPVKGDVGIVFIPESEIFNYVQQGDTTFYTQSIRGAYQAFFDSNIQADFVSVDDMAEYKLVYLPYPIMLTSETAAKLRKYVEQGGTVVCEGLPAYFGDNGHVGTQQPNYGLDVVFGARQSYVEFIPDIENDLAIQLKGKKVFGRYFRQEYELTGGSEAGRYENGRVAAVENKHGSGRTLLIGSFPGAGYSLHHGAETKEAFAGFLTWAGITPVAAINDNLLQARLQQGSGSSFLWVTNPSRDTRIATIRLAPAWGAFSSGEDIWGKKKVSMEAGQISLSIEGRNAAVIALR